MIQKQAIHEQTQSEQVLVVARHDLFAGRQVWHGVSQQAYADLVATMVQHQQFMPRPLAEHDARYKQIVPYLILMHDDTVFVVQRRGDATEQRLAGLLSLGIGGHIRAGDVVGADPYAWAHRELHEEISGARVSDHRFIGFINDDSNEVGQVHFGVVYAVTLVHRAIAINSELKRGLWLPIDALATAGTFEPWSQLILPFVGR